jgi:Ser-tRNA(Ala) deacylase AlaX
MRTEPLFQQDAYLYSCEAQVVESGPGGVVLDRSVFCPLGGGQPGDTGLLRAAVNELVAADHPVQSRWITDAELDRQPELVRTMSVQPSRGVGWIRLLEIPGVDLQPCGGTHVASTIEIGPQVVTKVESKGRRNKRVYPALAGHDS